MHHDLDVTLEEFQKTIGTNKIHLYQFMIARSKVQYVNIEDFEKYRPIHLLDIVVALTQLLENDTKLHI